jgi:hypothetical protein
MVLSFTVGLFVFTLLLLLSAASWTVILVRIWRSTLARTRALRTIRTFWDAGSFDEALARIFHQVLRSAQNTRVLCRLSPEPNFARGLVRAGRGFAGSMLTSGDTSPYPRCL